MRISRPRRHPPRRPHSCPMSQRRAAAMTAYGFCVCFAVFLVSAAQATGDAAAGADAAGADAARAHKRSARDISGADFFLRISSIFGGDVGRSAGGNGGDAKPDFITTFDIIRLLDERYAMKQFYCVVNEDTCDSVGLRLKASIPEAINRDCKRCTSTETSNIRRMVNYVKQNYPEFWLRVEPIYKDK